MPNIIVSVPDGAHCLRDNLKPCLLASWARHMQAYNCRLYGQLLQGGKFPRKCAACRAACEKEAPHED